MLGSFASGWLVAEGEGREQVLPLGLSAQMALTPFSTVSMRRAVLLPRALEVPKAGIQRRRELGRRAIAPLAVAAVLAPSVAFPQPLVPEGKEAIRFLGLDRPEAFPPAMVLARPQIREQAGLAVATVSAPLSHQEVGRPANMSS